jgi:cytochrome P450 PksS
MIFLLLIAGHETTVNLIGNATLALLENPEELNKLRMQPAMMPSAVEELARYDSPLELPNVRWARAELDIAGTTIPAGDPVFLSLTSANRDPAQFPSPDTLDLMRTPNRHLAFGQGAHYCLGAILARMETQIALSTLLGRLPEFRLAVPRGELRWRRSFVLRGLRSLPLAFESAATMAAKQG